MKKIIIAILTLIAIPTTAQITGDGYYRIQNNGSERYITITDDIVGGIDMSATTVDMANITTWRGFDNIKSDPASIIYINKVGSKYDLEAQGISVHAITNGQAYVALDYIDEDVYTISASAKGVSKSLYDVTSSKDYSSVADYGEGENMYWHIKPINTTSLWLHLT